MAISEIPIRRSGHGVVAQSSAPRVSSKRSRPFSSYVLIGAYSLCATALVFFLIRGFGYYTTSLEMRPHHSDYRLFRPAGEWGLKFGILGSLMMTGLLVYSLRKRTSVFSSKGKVKTWLNFHILCGIMGPLFITLHTSFKLDGLVALSFWSMVAVAMSGVFGRYLYQQIPRTIRGNTISLKECEARDKELLRLLEEHYGLTEAKRAQWARPQGKHPNSIFAMILQDLSAPFAWSKYRRQLASMTQLEPNRLEALFQNAKELWVLEKRMHRLEKVQKIFHLWHVIHLPFAAIMYLVMAIHIVIALLFAISWGGS